MICLKAHAAMLHCVDAALFDRASVVVCLLFWLLQVAFGEWQEWVQGKVRAFDDNFVHQVCHNGTQERIVLIAFMWHPDFPLSRGPHLLTKKRARRIQWHKQQCAQKQITGSG
jgi:hypothetical protein